MDFSRCLNSKKFGWVGSGLWGILCKEVVARPAASGHKDDCSANSGSGFVRSGLTAPKALLGSGHEQLCLGSHVCG